MIKRLASIALQLLLIAVLLFVGLFIYLFVAPLIQRNAIQMLSGPYLDDKKLLGPDARIDELWKWQWKAPLSIAIPKKLENCAASQILQTAVNLELLVVDSLCNVAAHESTKSAQVRCRSAFSSDSHICFATAYIGGLGFDWERQSFDQGRAQMNSHTYLREVTRMLVLDERISSLSTSEAYSRDFNGSFGKTPAELLSYVNSTNAKLKSGSYAQFSKYVIDIQFRWNYRSEFWEVQRSTGASTDQRYFDEFQDKFQVVVSPR